MSAFGKWLLLLAAAGLLAWSQSVAAGPESPAGLRVIVHPTSPITTTDRKWLAEVFLKKVTRWSNDLPVRPVDLHPDAVTRRRFSEEVLRRSVAAVKSYWQQMVFSGRQVPPPELDSEEQIVRYVARTPGGIGYVSNEATLEGVKLVSVR